MLRLMNQYNEDPQAAFKLQKGIQELRALLEQNTEMIKRNKELRQRNKELIEQLAGTLPARQAGRKRVSPRKRETGQPGKRRRVNP